MAQRFQLPVLTESTARTPEGLKRFTADVLGPHIPMPPSRPAAAAAAEKQQPQQQQQLLPRPYHSYYPKQQDRNYAPAHGVSLDSDADISSEDELSSTSLWNFHTVARKSLTPVWSKNGVQVRRRDDSQPPPHAGAVVPQPQEQQVNQNLREL